MLCTSSELDRIHTLAKEQAMADFWRGTDALVAHASHSAGRSAQRLAYRLARRAQTRVQTAPLVSVHTTPCEGV